MVLLEYFKNLETCSSNKDFISLSHSPFISVQSVFNESLIIHEIYRVVFHILKGHSFHKHFPEYDSKRPDIRLFTVTPTLKTFSCFPWAPEEKKYDRNRRESLN